MDIGRIVFASPYFYRLLFYAIAGFYGGLHSDAYLALGWYWIIFGFSSVLFFTRTALSRHDSSMVYHFVSRCRRSKGTYGSPARDIALWQPDIVLLQDVYPDHVRQIADELYAGQGDYRANQTNGIVTRWKILREIRNPLQRDEELTIQLPSGREIEVVNVHLHTAATDLRLWLKQTWLEHRQNRFIRRKELDTTLKILEQTTNFPNTATIFGGDFNSPASDAIHRKLSRDFIDAFASSGTGWGDTFHRRFPILRIDHIYTTRHFTAVRSIVATSRHSDHRMVIADVLLK